MQAGVEQGSQQSVDRRDTSRCPLEGDVLPELVDVFVTDRYDVVFIEGIGIALAILHLHQQGARQLERAEELLQLFEEAQFFQVLVNRLMLRILGRPIDHAHFAGRRGLCFRHSPQGEDCQRNNYPDRFHHARTQSSRHSTRQSAAVLLMSVSARSA